MDGLPEPEAAPTTDQPLTVEVLAHAPTAFYHCAHCEVVFRDAGIGPKIHDE